MQTGLASGAIKPPPTFPCDPACDINKPPFCTTHAECAHPDPCLTGLCSGGFCHHVPTCWDSMDCTVDTCVDNNGTADCTNTPSDAACDDNNTCTIDLCTAESPSNDCTHIQLACNDFDFCTDDSFCDPVEGCCVASAGCIAPPTCVAPTAVCVDEPGNERCVECTDDFHCIAPGLGACESGAGVCVECTANASCPAGEICNQATNVCVECLSEIDCTVDPLLLCDPTGTCVECDDDADCDDFNPCTDQRCILPAGDCLVTPRVPIEQCCLADAECDDGDSCTTDSCCDLPNGCSDTIHSVAINECFFDNDSDNDTVTNCVDACRDTQGCPQNNARNGCPCDCCDANDPLCCDPNDPNPLCVCP